MKVKSKEAELLAHSMRVQCFTMFRVFQFYVKYSVNFVSVSVCCVISLSDLERKKERI